KSFKNNIYFLPKNDVIKFFEILSPNDVYSILQSDDLAYDEQLVYEIASNYCFKLSDTKVMSFVRLCALSNEFLVTQIKNNPSFLRINTWKNSKIECIQPKHQHYEICQVQLSLEFLGKNMMVIVL